jgi:pantetheine-phosphate adenylyltransferase
MRIGVFSGSFDPVTKGHEWIIQESYQSYDLFYVVIGYHPHKDFMFSKEQRLDMLKDVVPNEVIVDSGSIKKYLKKLRNNYPDSEITLVRGIRDVKDFEYEFNINVSHLEYPAIDNLKQVWLMPPKNIANVSSTKERQKIGLLSTSQHVIEMKDTVFYKNCPKINNARRYFEKCLKAGIVQLAKTITAAQVNKTLDAAPIDVISSDFFFLKEVDLEKIHVYESRYQTHSTSVGPVMIDDANVVGKTGLLVIEGKHRFLDAKERGEKTILAYVGNKCN